MKSLVYQCFKFLFLVKSDCADVLVRTTRWDRTKSRKRGGGGSRGKNDDDDDGDDDDTKSSDYSHVKIGDLEISTHGTLALYIISLTALVVFIVEKFYRLVLACMDREAFRNMRFFENRAARTETYNLRSAIAHLRD